MNFFKTIGRMFTIPRSVRNQIDANPIALEVQAALKQELDTVITSTVASHVSDPYFATVVSSAIGHAIDSTGIFN
jgi:hypothetical protein